MSFVLESCSTEELCIASGSSEKILYQLRHELENWMTLQPHLPQGASKKRLEWFLHSTKFSLERAKQRLDMYYSMKQLVPEIFTNRDPRRPGITSTRNVMHLVILPKLGPGIYRTVILRITETDCSKLNAWEIIKNVPQNLNGRYISMVADIRMIEGHCFGENVVIDLSMVNLRHLMMCTPTLIKKCDIIARKAYASRVKGIHFLNAPACVDYLITAIKPVLGPKLSSRVHIYQEGNLEKFYQFVPKSILPKDYGGDQPTMTELDAALREKIDEWRDWFIEHEQIEVNEHLRSAPVMKEDSVFGYFGSFRKIEVD